MNGERQGQARFQLQDAVFANNDYSSLCWRMVKLHCRLGKENLVLRYFLTRLLFPSTFRHRGSRVGMCSFILFYIPLLRRKQKLEGMSNFSLGSLGMAVNKENHRSARNGRLGLRYDHLPASKLLKVYARAASGKEAQTLQSLCSVNLVNMPICSCDAELSTPHLFLFLRTAQARLKPPFVPAIFSPIGLVRVHGHRGVSFPFCKRLYLAAPFYFSPPPPTP